MKRKDLWIVFALWLASCGLVAMLVFGVLSATSAHGLGDELRALLRGAWEWAAERNG